MASLLPAAAAASSPAGAPARSKKRPASPGTGGGPAKKKKVAAAAGGSQSAGGEAMNENKFLNTDSSTGSVETAVKPLPFKDPKFIILILMLLHPLSLPRNIPIFQDFQQITQIPRAS